MPFSLGSTTGSFNFEEKQGPADQKILSPAPSPVSMSRPPHAVSSATAGGNQPQQPGASALSVCVCVRPDTMAPSVRRRHVVLCVCAGEFDPTSYLTLDMLASGQMSGGFDDFLGEI
jgi:hypothetical protein